MLRTPAPLKGALGVGFTMSMLLIIAIFFLSLFLGEYVAVVAVRSLGFDTTSDGPVLYVVMGAGFVTALISTYVAGNLIEGQGLRATLAVVGNSTRRLIFGLLLFIVIALLAWAIFGFVSSTPVWAIVIIVLLLLILLK